MATSEILLKPVFYTTTLVVLYILKLVYSCVRVYKYAMALPKPPTIIV